MLKIIVCTWILQEEKDLGGLEALNKLGTLVTGVPGSFSFLLIN